MKRLILLTLLLSSCAVAKDLGTWGELYPVAEQDMLTTINTRLQAMKDSGELDMQQEAFKKRVIEKSLRPEPVFEALDVSPEVLESVRKSRAEYLNLQRIKQGKARINPGELISIAWQTFRKRFREYRLVRKAYGEKKNKSRKEAQLTFRQISERVRKELTKEIAKGLFVSDLPTLRNEIKRRVKERMLLARSLSVVS
ncbi:hypothetical protein [Enterobacter huaxiensis]|uniref:hypothetical protein n=1 Tax=Enterobacter huaxiensis TaxID=2494702 RepID=UPI0021D8289E|nr:hypothetical protein [Enterobacter huaxiensis]